jgi:multidrug resistance efflux pump
MAIKFRRIEDRKQSPAQLRMQQENGRERRRILPKVILVLLAVVAGLVAWFYLRPPRIAASFIVHVDPIEVAAPAAGTVTYLIGPEVETVEAGAVIARINARPDAAGSAAARLTDLQLRTVQAMAEVESARADAAAVEAEAQRRERELALDVLRLEDEVERLGAAAESAQRELERLTAETERLEGLRAVGAATRAELDAAVRGREAAREAHDAVQDRAETARLNLAAAVQAARDYSEAKAEALDAAQGRVRGAGRSLKVLAAALEPQEAAFGGGGSEFIVRAPTGGRVLAVHATRNSYARQGEPLVSLYQPSSRVARAFVPVRWRHGLREGAPARLYLKGRDGHVSGQVVGISERVVPLPGSLRHRVGYDEPNVIPVDIALAAGATDQPVAPGEVGKAVIEK